MQRILYCCLVSSPSVSWFSLFSLVHSRAASVSSFLMGSPTVRRLISNIYSINRSATHRIYCSSPPPRVTQSEFWGFNELCAT
ncbi:hypothetical protein BC835DRAFT_1345069, partial [Cytidiella melzeri]